MNRLELLPSQPEGVVDAPDSGCDEVPSPEVIRSHLAALDAAWCLRRLLIETAKNPNDDAAAQHLYESSGNVYPSAPRQGFKCFSEGCTSVIRDGREWAKSPTELTGCKYIDEPSLSLDPN